MAGKITTDSIQSDSISNKAGTGAPDFPNGLSTDGSTSFTYTEATVVLDNGITGTAKFVRVGNMVTMMGTGGWTHATASSASSSAGIIPAAFRPTVSAYNVFISLDGSLAGCYRIAVQSNGSIDVAYYDSNFTLVNRTGTLVSPCVSYVIT